MARHRRKHQTQHQPNQQLIFHTPSFWDRASDRLSRARQAMGNAFSSSWRIAILLGACSQIPSAIASPFLKFMSGEYNGLNTCLGALSDCIQGYALQENTNETSTLAFRWSRSVASSSGSLTDAFFQKLMKDVITEQRMEQLFEQALAGGNLLADSVCTLPTSIWSSIQALGQAVGLDPSACNVAKNLFTLLTQEAHDTAVKTWGGIIAGGVLGVAALLAIAAIAYCCCRQDCCHKPACLRDYKSV